MDRPMRIFSPGTAWRALSSALLLAFLLRAVIPAGFMPAQANGQAGFAGMTFCIAGLPAAAAQSAAPGKSDTPAEPQALHCIFNVATSQGALLLAPPALIPAVIYLVRTVSIRPAAVADESKVKGPPLGARAPPQPLSFPG
jgi:hypothetical protein